MNQYKNTSFLKLSLRFIIVFFVLVTIMRLFIGFFKLDGMEGLKNAYLNEGKWKAFLQIQAMMSVFYGLFMAGYYKFIKK
ncbi:MAG: hypothetical protein COB73_08835 [Flavobacteriaceae bacterium]|nr:MAG: hypothetical protein COB73_08835 [Flavobacteriaceae bacterium]